MSMHPLARRLIEKLMAHTPKRGASYRRLLSNQRGIWLFALTALTATGTIAAIHQNDTTPTNVAQGMIATPPPEIIQVSDPNGGMREITSLAQIMRAEAPSVARVETPDTASEAYDWKQITIRRGDNLGAILRKRGLYSSLLHQALLGNGTANALRRLTPGRVLHLGLDSEGWLQELVYDASDNSQIHLRRDASGDYAVSRVTRSYETRYAYIRGVIDSSLFVAGQEAGLSDALIMELTGIFGWDIDFALDLRQGDSFSAIHEEKYWRGEKIADGPILAAEFVNRGRVYRAINHRNDHGKLGYYTPTGLSMQRQFLRTPVQYSRISSRYSMKGRYHPILKRWRAHRGVDYAARHGSPVRATATGRVLTRRRKGGYGKTVVIKHGGKYSTLYAHLSRFKRGVQAGSLVKQGQIIGYVGKTGLATGPHLHYEFRINGVHRNPLTVRLPKAKSIAALYHAQFLANTRLWREKLDLIGGKTQVASQKLSLVTSH